MGDLLMRRGKFKIDGHRLSPASQNLLILTLSNQGARNYKSMEIKFKTIGSLTNWLGRNIMDWDSRLDVMNDCVTKANLEDEYPFILDVEVEESFKKNLN